MVVCDLDGTLLRSDASLSPFAHDGLNRLLDAGIHLTVASARSVHAMRALLDGVRLRLPVIELNGALITEMSTGDHVVVKALEPGAASAAVSVLNAHGAGPVLTTWDGRRDRVRFTTTMVNAASAWFVAEKRAYSDPRLALTDDLVAVAEHEDIVLLTGFVPDAVADTVVAHLTADVGTVATVTSAHHIYCTGWTEIQVQHLHADKGHAVTDLLELTGMQSANVLACGDHINDLAMFAIAHETIVPTNAHEAAIAAATTLVASNDDDGVVHWLLQRAGLW
jgi:5-amino-6-(5-phospho-D-ribitylamino)uracil phosphatase